MLFWCFSISVEHILHLFYCTFCEDNYWLGRCSNNSFYVKLLFETVLEIFEDYFIKNPLNTEPATLLKNELIHMYFLEFCTTTSEMQF